MKTKEEIAVEYISKIIKDVLSQKFIETRSLEPIEILRFKLSLEGLSLKENNDIVRIDTNQKVATLEKIECTNEEKTDLKVDIKLLSSIDFIPIQFTLDSIKNES